MRILHNASLSFSINEYFNCLWAIIFGNCFGPSQQIIIWILKQLVQLSKEFLLFSEKEVIEDCLVSVRCVGSSLTTIEKKKKW